MLSIVIYSFSVDNLTYLSFLPLFNILIITIFTKMLHPQYLQTKFYQIIFFKTKEKP